MRHVRCGRMSLLFASVGIYTTTSFAAHRLLACWPPLPVVGLLASPASSHVSAPPRPHSHERRCTVSTRLNFTHRHTSTFTQHVHIHNTFFACQPWGCGRVRLAFKRRVRSLVAGLRDTIMLVWPVLYVALRLSSISRPTAASIMRRPGAVNVIACDVSSIAGTRYPGAMSVSARRVSSITGCEGTYEDSDESPEDDDEVPDAINVDDKLDPVSMKNYPLASLLEMEEEGQLELRPFYQRGYKWTQKQASLWIESMLRGYPCLPEVTLIEQQSDEGSYAVFDGQQRLTSMKLFIKGERADTWKATNAQKKAGTTHTFALEGLLLLKSLEGKTFKDLEPKQQQLIKRKYDVRCAIIPDTWSMTDYVDFFRRIQGGGTPMSDQELRRAIARGPFADLLDAIAGCRNNDKTASSLLHEALKGAKLQPDEVQELLLRYFALQSESLRSFGRPSMIQHGLEVMRRLNTNHGVKLTEWERSLEAALEAVIIVFPNEQERFRRAKRSLNGEFQKSDGVNKAIWDCLLYSFAKPGRKEALIENAVEVRKAFIELMQTHPAFESLATKGTDARITAWEAVLDKLLSITTVASPVSPRQRSQLIKSARDADKPCGICKQALGPSDDLLHIDHKVPRALGGSSDTENLHVVHKACNLKKGVKDLPSPLD